MNNLIVLMKFIIHLDYQQRIIHNNFVERINALYYHEWIN